MKTPPVTVMLPTYNRAHFLPTAVESVLGQTRGDFELVVVDDGSTDETPAVMEAFRDERIRLIRQENRGISGALNRALAHARGEIIARIDSDDRWLPNLLEKEMGILEKRPEVGLVYSRAQAMDETGRPLAQVLGVPERYPGETLKSLLYGDFVCTITTLVRKRCLDEAGPFDESLSGNEDWDMWIRLAPVCKFHFLDEVLAHFRMHSHRTTGKGSPLFDRVARGRFRTLDKAFGRKDLGAELLQVKGLAYRNAHMDVGLRWLSAGEISRMGHHFRCAFREGGNPVDTLARICFLVLHYRYLSKRTWGVRLVERLAAAGRRRRGRDRED